MNPAVWLWLAVAAWLAGALFSTLQFAVRTVTRGSLEQVFEEQRRKRSRTRTGPGASEGAANGDAAAGEGVDPLPPGVSAIAADLYGHAAAVAIPRIACNLVVGVSMVLWLAAEWNGGVPQLWHAATGVGVGVLAIWLLSVVVPLGVAEHAPELAVLRFSGFLRAIHLLATPILAVVGFTREVIRRLAGEEPMTPEQEHEAELLSLVEVSEREGGLEEDVRDMIEAVVEFRSTTVEEIMTPRTQVQALEYTDDLAAVEAVAREAGHSRVPVYRDNLDHIVGVLYLKDLLRWMVSREPAPAAAAAGPAAARPFVLADILRPATFVPETKTVRELLGELLDQKVHIAFATDEYGGTSGLVTIEDIIEEVFGEIRDEYEPEAEETPPVVVDAAGAAAVVDARTPIDEANDGLEDLGLELPEGDDWDTVGGFVTTTMGKIPEAGETLRHAGLVITVLEAEPTRVVRVRVEAMPEAHTADAHPAD